MGKRLMQVAIGLVVVFAAAQLIRPESTERPIDSARTIQAQPGTTPQLVAVLERACNNCHSNHSVWPSYSQVAPLSWLVARGVAEGRKAVNFSEWVSYSSDQQRALLALSCQDAKQRRMPMGAYTALFPESKLSTQDIETICAASLPAAPKAPAG